MSEATISGTGELQAAIQALLDKYVAEGKQRGLQIAVYHRGKMVVDAWAGVADVASGRPVDGDTLFPVYSVTKGIAATLANLVVERGLVAYDTPMVKVWPEFAAKGKETITFQHALTHQAGLPNLPAGLDHGTLCNWDAMCKAMAEETPVVPPASKWQYHAITYAWTVGEVVRRVDGRPIPQMIREEIEAPLGLKGAIFSGLPESEDGRVASLTSELPPEPVLPDPQAIPALVQPLDRWMMRNDARRACIPASNGIMTARGIARHYAALLPGGVDGVSLLPQERVRVASASYPAPERTNDSLHQGMGYRKAYFMPETFGHGGFGGATGFADLPTGYAVGFARNHFSSHDPLVEIFAALKKAAGVVEKG
jgi:CubicO group peptidase (beta-lactamase class C family)